MTREQSIMERVHDHLDESFNHFDAGRIVGVFLQGSQNYGLDYEKSDVDTKLIITPTFRDIAFNKSPISTTHIRDNEEHIDFKDIRLYIQTFRKQNINFLEILFTDFKWVNYHYAPFWDILVEHREEIARYNLFQAVKSMKGVAMEKYHAMEHAYPSKAAVLAEYGYDPKQLHHLIRIEEFIGRYISGERYVDCLKPRRPDYLLEVKKGYYNLESARVIGATAITNVERVADAFTAKVENKGTAAVDEILDSVQYDIMKYAIEQELRQ